jgi:hypothetical protein
MLLIRFDVHDIARADLADFAAEVRDETDPGYVPRLSLGVFVPRRPCARREPHVGATGPNPDSAKVATAPSLMTKGMPFSRPLSGPRIASHPSSIDVTPEPNWSPGCATTIRG